MPAIWSSRTSAFRSPLFDELEGPYLELLTRERMRGILPVRAAESHKGDFGRVVIVAGSLGKTGAAHLSALGALRSGAGLVTVATPRSCLPILASMGAEYMTRAARRDAVRRHRLRGARSRAGSHVRRDCGGPRPRPGADRRAAFVQGLLERAGVPLVLDADALNAFAGEPERLVGRDGVDVVITPHPGEMARLINGTTEAVQHDRLGHAREFAASHRVHVVLKGHRTIVAGPDGRSFINLTGNPGMATGGTGDLLTGMIAAWIAQLLDAEAACKLSVYLHGAAGDLAEADEGADCADGDRHRRADSAMRCSI